MTTVTFTIGARAMTLAGLNPESYPLSQFERLPDGRPLLKLRASVPVAEVVLRRLESCPAFMEGDFDDRRAVRRCAEKLESRISIARRGRTHITKNNI